RRASLLAGAGHPRDALRIVDAMGSIRSARTRGEVNGARAVALVNVGRFDEAGRVAREAVQEHSHLSSSLDRRGIAQHVINEAHALAYAGHYREARELLEPGAGRAPAAPADGDRPWLDTT